MALGVAHYEMLLTNSRECKDATSYLLTSLHVFHCNDMCTYFLLITCVDVVLYNYTCTYSLYNYMCTCCPL